MLDIKNLNACVYCFLSEDESQIDVYTSVYWEADTEEEYKEKEKIINEWKYEDDLFKAFAWCDIGGYEYWMIKQEECNYVSIDVILKKPYTEYTQEELQKLIDLIDKWDTYFINKLT